MRDIPTGFLKLPDMEYLKEEPDQPYKFPTSGMVHSSKFVEILQEVTENRFPDIYKIMDGHKLERVLDQFSTVELADFCRHVLVINRDKIGWQVVDKYLVLLDKRTGLATWKRVDLVFIEELNHFFSTLIKWHLNHELLELMQGFVKSPLRLSLSDEEVMERIHSNYQFWKIKDLWILFEDFVYNKTTNPEQFKRYQPLLNRLLELFDSQINKSNISTVRKVSYLVMLSRGYAALSSERIQNLHELAERTWVQLGNVLESTDYKSYRYLYAIIYGHIGRKYYQTNITFIHKRQLLNTMIESYFQFDNISVEEWLNQVVMAETDLFLKEFILSGILTILEILNEFALELVESKKLGDIRTRVETLASSLFEISFKLLLFEFNQEELSQGLVYYIEELQSRKGDKLKPIFGICEVITTSFKIVIYYNGRPTVTNEDLELVGAIKSIIHGDIRGKLYQFHLALITGNYPVEDTLAKINYETKQTNSIINSATFEREIIQLASEVMEEIKLNYNRNNRLLIKEMHQLFYFIAHWLQIFREIQLYQDVLMVCSPILSIIQVQLIQAYYEQNQHSLAFIEYLSMQHFASVVRNEMDIVGSRDHLVTISFLAEEMQSMIQEWRIPEITDIKSIATKIKAMQFDIDSPQGNEGMIDDDIVLGFVELATKMEEAIETSNQGIELHELGSTMYEEPSPGNHIFQRIGHELQDIMEIPLIRNSKQYNAALSVVPLTVSLSGDMVDLDMNSLLNHFLELGDEF